MIYRLTQYRTYAHILTSLVFFFCAALTFANDDKPKLHGSAHVKSKAFSQDGGPQQEVDVKTFSATIRKSSQFLEALKLLVIQWEDEYGRGDDNNQITVPDIQIVVPVNFIDQAFSEHWAELVKQHPVMLSAVLHVGPPQKNSYDVQPIARIGGPLRQQPTQGPEADALAEKNSNLLENNLTGASNRTAGFAVINYGLVVAIWAVWGDQINHEIMTSAIDTISSPDIDPMHALEPLANAEAEASSTKYRVAAGLSWGIILGYLLNYRAKSLLRLGTAWANWSKRRATNKQTPRFKHSRKGLRKLFFKSAPDPVDEPDSLTPQQMEALSQVTQEQYPQATEAEIRKHLGLIGMIMTFTTVNVINLIKFDTDFFQRLLSTEYLLTEYVPAFVGLLLLANAGQRLDGLMNKNGLGLTSTEFAPIAFFRRIWMNIVGGALTVYISLDKSWTLPIDSLNTSVSFDIATLAYAATLGTVAYWWQLSKTKTRPWIARGNGWFSPVLSTVDLIGAFTRKNLIQPIEVMVGERIPNRWSQTKETILSWFPDSKAKQSFRCKAVFAN